MILLPGNCPESNVAEQLFRLTLQMNEIIWIFFTPWPHNWMMGREWLSLLEILSNHFAEQQVIMILATGKIFVLHYNNGTTANIQNVCHVSSVWYLVRNVHRVAEL